jgi:hypothetical protein
MTALEKFRFDGDELALVRRDDALWVVVKRVCEALGVDESGQRRRLKDKAWATADIISAVAEDGKNRELFAINLDTLPMWLATIETSRVRAEIRPKLEHYQRECARVLRDHFVGRRENSSDSPDPLHELARVPRGELRDDGGRVDQFRRLMRAAAHASRVSFQAVHGRLRKTYQVLSYRRLPVFVVDAAMRWLLELIEGKAAIVTRRALPAKVDNYPTLPFPEPWGQ